MALKTVTLKVTADPNTTASALSTEVLDPATVVAIYVHTTVPDASNTIRIFLTRSPFLVAEPQPGDPPLVDVVFGPFADVGTQVFVVPVVEFTEIQPPFRIAVVVSNAHATTAMATTITLLYRTRGG